jgi:hypothetical protein
VSFFIIIFKPVTEKRIPGRFQNLLPMKPGVTGFTGLAYMAEDRG